jgi:hypothetical protein
MPKKIRSTFLLQNYPKFYISQAQRSKHRLKIVFPNLPSIF